MRQGLSRALEVYCLPLLYGRLHSHHLFSAASCSLHEVWLLAAGCWLLPRTRLYGGTVPASAALLLLLLKGAEPLCSVQVAGNIIMQEGPLQSSY